MMDDMFHVVSTELHFQLSKITKMSDDIGQIGAVYEHGADFSLGQVRHRLQVVTAE